MVLLLQEILTLTDECELTHSPQVVSLVISFYYTGYELCVVSKNSERGRPRSVVQALYSDPSRPQDSSATYSLCVLLGVISPRCSGHNPNTWGMEWFED